MSSRILRHPAFADDLDGVLAYIERYSTTTADEFKRRVFATLTELAEMPGAGGLKFFRGRELSGLRSWSVRLSKDPYPLSPAC